MSIKKAMVKYIMVKRQSEMRLKNEIFSLLLIWEGVQCNYKRMNMAKFSAIKKKYIHTSIYVYICFYTFMRIFVCIGIERCL